MMRNRDGDEPNGSLQQPAGPVQVTDWTKVRPGELLEVRHAGHALASGSADGVTSDGTMIWLLQAYPEGRALFHKIDGISLRRLPRE